MSAESGDDGSIISRGRHYNITRSHQFRFVIIKNPPPPLPSCKVVVRPSVRRLSPRGVQRATVHVRKRTQLQRVRTRDVNNNTRGERA